MDVALGPCRPEYRPDILRPFSLHVAGLLPGEGLLWVLAPETQLTQDLNHGNFTIESVEVKTINLQVIIDNECTTKGGVTSAEGKHLLNDL